MKTIEQKRRGEEEKKSGIHCVSGMKHGQQRPLTGQWNNGQIDANYTSQQ